MLTSDIAKKVFMKEIYAQSGSRPVVLSEKGSAFKVVAWVKCSVMIGFKTVTISVYRLQASGRSEKMIQRVTLGLARMAQS